LFYLPFVSNQRATLSAGCQASHDEGVPTGLTETMTEGGDAPGVSVPVLRWQAVNVRALSVSSPPRLSPLDSRVSTQMSRMPRTGTKPEVDLRRELHARGLRFRVARSDLPGRPDLSLSRARLAVFVDGCYWHACQFHGTLPKNNREWWRAKFAGNVERDRRKDEELVELGWLPVHFWEHEAAVAAADEVERLWRLRTGRLDKTSPRPPTWHPGGHRAHPGEATP